MSEAEFRRLHPLASYFLPSPQPNYFPMVTRLFVSDVFFGHQGVFRPSRSLEYCNGVAIAKRHAQMLPGLVCSWEESRAYWKPRLEAETWEDWLHVDGEKAAIIEGDYR